MSARLATFWTNSALVIWTIPSVAGWGEGVLPEPDPAQRDAMTLPAPSQRHNPLFMRLFALFGRPGPVARPKETSGPSGNPAKAPLRTRDRKGYSSSRARAAWA